MIQIRDDYERSSVDLSASSVAGDGDAAVVTMAPRATRSNDIAGGQRRWLEPSAELVGVLGLRPTLRWSGMVNNSYADEGGYHGAPWQASRRCMFSTDGGLTWRYFATTVVHESSGFVEFRHDAPFTADRVRVSRGRQMSVSQAGAWLAALAQAHPGKLVPADSALSHVPSSQVAQFPAQQFIAAEFAPQLDERGQVIPATPLYAGMIDDASLTPVGGGRKRVAILAAGVHAGEDHANFVLQAVVQALLGNSPAALALRRELRIPFYPVANPPGRVGGGFRGSFTVGRGGEDDANRHFIESGTGLQIIDLPKAAMSIDLRGEPLALAIDSHGTYGSRVAVFEDPGVPASGEFARRLNVALGGGVVDEGDSHPGFLSEYLRSIGASPAVTLETGDPSPVSDAQIAAIGQGVVDALVGMVVGVAPAPVTTPAPTPAPAPAQATAPAGPLVMTEGGAGPSRYVEYAGAAADDLPAMTVIAYVRPTGQGANLGYLLGKGNSAGAPRRFFVDHNGGAPRIAFGLGSAGATFSPSASSAYGSVVYGQWQHLEVTWDGSLNGSGIALAVNGAASVGERTSGAGAITSDAGHPLVLLNRGDRARGFAGDPGWIGVWRRVLSVAERAVVRQSGPDAVPDGLVVSRTFTQAAPAPAPSSPSAPAPATTPTTLRGTLLAGGALSATQNPDGTWSVTITATVGAP